MKFSRVICASLVRPIRGLVGGWRRIVLAVGVVALLASVGWSLKDEVGDFTEGTPISASAVNKRFAALYTAVSAMESPYHVRYRKTLSQTFKPTAGFNEFAPVNFDSNSDLAPEPGLVTLNPSFAYNVQVAGVYLVTTNVSVKATSAPCELHLNLKVGNALTAMSTRQADSQKFYSMHLNEMRRFKKGDVLSLAFGSTEQACGDLMIDGGPNDPMSSISIGRIAP